MQWSGIGPDGKPAGGNTSDQVPGDATDIASLLYATGYRGLTVGGVTFDDNDARRSYLQAPGHPEFYEPADFGLGTDFVDPKRYGRHAAPVEDPGPQPPAAADPPVDPPKRTRDRPARAPRRFPREIDPATLGDDLGTRNVDHPPATEADGPLVHATRVRPSDVAGGAPVHLRLAQWGEPDERISPYIDVRTPRSRRDEVEGTLSMSDREAARAAKEIRELADLADQGYVPPKPTKFSKAAELVRREIEDDRDTQRTTKVPLGYDDTNLPITYGDLIDLCEKASPEHVGQPKTRRVVRSDDATAEWDLDSGSLWAELTGGEIRITATEGRESPGSSYGTARMSTAGARQFADDLDQYAAGVRHVKGHSSEHAE